ncbi:MAG: site-2 protease family protein [Hyphomicrobiaceae bacterium]
MLGGSFPLFRVGGTLLQVHATFPLLLAFVGYQGWMSGGAAGAAFSVVFILLLFVCVVLHEFGHVAAARRYGIRTPTVTLSPIGGIAALERMPEKPSQEVVVALAGPAVTLAIAVVLFLGLGFGIDVEELTRSQAGVVHLVNRIAMANVALLVFNLIPAFPMDGGRVLRGLLSAWLGHARATLIAARIGQAIALVLAALGLLYDPLLMLVAAFVFLAAEAELRHSKRARSGRTATAGDVRITNLVSFTLDNSVAEAASMAEARPQSAFPVRDGTQQIVGSVTRERLAEAFASGAHGARMSELVTPGLPTIPTAMPIADAWPAVMSSTAPLVGVVDEHGRLTGFLSREHLLSLAPKAARRARPTGPLVPP